MAPLVTDSGTCATAIGVFAGVAQLRFNQRQARPTFEDNVSSNYRALVAELPVEAMMDCELSAELQLKSQSVFYRYFDLCNEQIYVHQTGRVTDTTWDEWRAGIETNLRRRAFRTAWSQLAGRIGGDFQEFREEFGPILREGG
jgi:hypothetical protein